MDYTSIITLVIGIAACWGGYVGGKKNSVSANSTIQAEAIEALKARVQDQDRTIAQIPALLDRIRVLEELVTQKAEVEKVIEIVTRIEERVNATPGQP